jgi:hypothetical protein
LVVRRWSLAEHRLMLENFANDSFSFSNFAKAPQSAQRWTTTVVGIWPTTNDQRPTTNDQRPTTNDETAFLNLLSSIRERTFSNRANCYNSQFYKSSCNSFGKFVSG